MESPENDFCWSKNGVINVNETQKKAEVEYFSIITADRNVFEELKKGNVHFQQIEYCTFQHIYFYKTDTGIHNCLTKQVSCCWAATASVG